MRVTEKTGKPRHCGDGRGTTNDFFPRPWRGPKIASSEISTARAAHLACMSRGMSTTDEAPLHIVYGRLVFSHLCLKFHIIWFNERQSLRAIPDGPKGTDMPEWTTVHK